MNKDRSFRISALYGVLTTFVIGFIVLPLLLVVWMSFFSNKILAFPPDGYTLDWYVRAWQIDEFREGLWVSLQTSLIAMAGSLLLGIPASLVLARTRFPGREVINTLLMSPMIVPGIVGGSALYISFLEFEMVSGIQIAGRPLGLIIAHTLIALPWTVRLVTTSLVGMNLSVEEAAASLGASRFSVFWRITLPMIRPGVIAASLFSFVISFIDLEKSIFLVGPGRTTLQIALVNYLEWNIDPTVGAVATVQMLLIATLLLLTQRYVSLSRAF